VNPLTTHQHAAPTSTTSSTVEQPHRREPTATEQLLIRQHDLGVPVDVIAAVTHPTVRELRQLIARHGTATQPHSGPNLTHALWHTDLAILTGALHGTRTTITLGHTPHRRRRRTGRPSFKARLGTLLIEQHPRLLDHIDTLPAPERASAVLRLVVVAVAHTDAEVVTTLTDTAQQTLAHADANTGAGLLGWLAALHATHGHYDRALDFSATQLQLLTGPPPFRQKNDPCAQLHARWCRAGLLALAGQHTAARDLHADLPRVLAETAAAVLSTDEDHDEFDLIEARTHAAAGTQALHAGLDTAATGHLTAAADCYELLLRNLGWHPFPANMLRYELTLARFTLGYALHRLSPGTGDSEWSACARDLHALPAPGHLEQQHANRIIKHAQAALSGQVPDFPDTPARLPLPRLPLSEVSSWLLEDGALWDMPLAPNAGAPDLPHLH